jgi:hypothetical protein
MDTRRLVVPFLLCCLALTLFLGTVKIGYTTGSQVTYYFRDDLPSHGQDSGTGWDYGTLNTSAPTTTETRNCTGFVAFWFDEDDQIKEWIITKIHWHIYWKAQIDAQIGYQCNGTANAIMDYNISIGTATDFQLYESIWDVNITSPNISNSYYFALKLYSYSDLDGFGYPWVRSEPAHLSYVTFEVKAYILHGPYYEDGQVANCITNVTLYSKTSNPYSFVLNGTDGVADTVTIGNNTAAWYFQWNASSTNSRSYFLESSTLDEFWVYVADPTKTYAAYTISFLDLAGVLKTMPHVKAERYIDGIKIVERATVDIEKKVIFYMEAYASYSITIEDDTVTYAFGDLIFGSSTSITLTIKAVDFPKQTLFTYKYVRVYGERALGTPNGTITIMYQDTLNKTNGVQIWINYKNGTNIVYTNILANSTFVYTWTSASNDTDYAVALGITHETYGYYGWKQYFPRSLSDMPWGMAWFGTLPFNTAYVLPAMLIVFAGACFSVVNAYVGAFMMVIMAVLESYIGWLPIPASVIVVAFTFAIIMAIIYAKRKIQS